MRRWRLAGAAVAVVVLLAGGCGLLLGVHAETALLLVAVGVGGGLAVVATRRALRHARLARELARISRPGHLAGVPVRTAPGLGPMVAGLVRPAVYCGDDVPSRLTPGQQRAVLLHERCHQVRRDPVRLVLLEAVERLFGRVPPVRRRIDVARADLEVRADRYALERGATRPDLAGALLTMAGAHPGGATAGFGTVTQQRLAALLDGMPAPRRRRRWPAVIALAAAGIAAWTACVPTLAAAHPELLFAARCVTAGCSVGG